MDGLTWLIISWLIVGVICYFMLTKVGTPHTEANININNTTRKSHITSSKHNSDEYSTDWLNDIIAWLFNNMHRVPETLQAWIIAMNEAAKKISSPGKFEVLFESFSDNKNVTKIPRITDIRIQQTSNDHLIIKGKINIPQINLKLMSSQRTGDRLLITNYDAKITDLHGEIEIRLACIANQIYMMACFCGRPELDIELINKDLMTTGAVSATMVDEMIRKCLLSAVTNVSLTEAGGQGGGRMATGMVPPNVCSIIPHMMTRNDDRPDMIDNRADLATIPTQEMMKRSSVINHVPKQQAMPNKMHVKVIRAEQLGSDHIINQSYVVLEMDEPAQKFQTRPSINMNPYWDESFDFNLTPASEEILFEIYESTSVATPTGRTGQNGQNGHRSNQFLGLAIVSLGEVRYSNANMLHTLKLQGRPYRNDVVTGNLIVQFDFYCDSVTTSIGKEIVQNTIRNNINQFRETTSSTTRPIYDPRDNFGAHNAQDMIAKTTTATVKTQSANDKIQPSIGSSSAITVQQTSITPMVYDSHGQRIGTNDMQQQQHASYATTTATIRTGQYEQPGSATSSRMQQHVIPGSSAGSTFDTQNFPTGTKDLHTADIDNYPYQRYDMQEAEALTKIEKTKIKEMPQTDEVHGIRQSRGQMKMRVEGKTDRKRDHSFFSELRKRLSGSRRSKRRAKSCDLGIGEMEEAVSLPPSRDISRTRFSEKAGSGHDLTSFGERSERSTKSLYQHSTLVLETRENGQKRYYLIPSTVLDKPEVMKLLRQGKKLHIYNDHTFVAVKCRSGTVCNVCHQRIGRSSFGKQAYQCRDCHTVCHKQCHYKTESFCTASSVNKLNITKDIDWEYVLTASQIGEFISEDGV
ncbi:Protein kinase C-like [Dirofilaria immitis]